MKFFNIIINCFRDLTKKSSSPSVVKQTLYEDTMETQIEPVEQVRDWAIEKIQMLYDSNNNHNADAIFAEFDEWINIPDDNGEITYLCLEDNEWTDQEIDVR